MNHTEFQEPRRIVVWAGRRAEGIGGFLKENWLWLRSVLASDTIKGAPDHRNVIGLTLAGCFAYAFAKKTVGSSDIPDIPPGWQMVLLVTLGIGTAATAVDNLINRKVGAKVDPAAPAPGPAPKEEVPAEVEK